MTDSLARAKDSITGEKQRFGNFTKRGEFFLAFLARVVNLGKISSYRIGRVVMKGLAARSWLRLSAGAALALFAVGFLSPVRARAACGDYVTFGSEQGSHSGYETPNTPPAQPCQECPQRSGQKPCHGPYCDGGQTPAPQPPTTAPVRLHDWACLLKLPVFAPTGSISLWSLGDNQNRIHHTVSIYHPPRPI